ncbi:MAG TPA: cation diffusion facilitator family transporter [Blastocatellia bacterium]|nr:cation diffusion facilitator family transporter [Blastocatellia bacterium]
MAEKRPVPISEAEKKAKDSSARLSIAVAGFLIIIKTIIGILTGSISVWASLLDSAMDIVASIVNLLAIRAAARPADEHHAYGHGKAESLAALFQSIVIAASGVFLIREAVIRILTPVQIRSEWLGILGMLVAVVVSIALVVRLTKVAVQTDSLAIKSDAQHYKTDIYTTLSALLSLLISSLFHLTIADPVISIAIAIYIIWSAIWLAKDSIDILMDKRLPSSIDEQIAGIIGRYEPFGVLGFHDLRTRRSGSIKFIDLHLEVEHDKSLKDAHEITEEVLRVIESEIPRSKVQIHTDPGRYSEHQDDVRSFLSIDSH